MSVIVKGGGGKPEEEKTVTAGTSTKVVTPSDGKTIKKVTVNPTPSQSKTVSPSTSQQTVSPDSGKLLSQVIVKAMEDLAPEVTAQTPMISQILSNLGFTADSASGTNKQKLQTNNANLAKISDYLPHGAYVWKKLTAQNGDFVDFVVSDQSTAYPDGGTQDVYWYERVVEGVDLMTMLGCTKMTIDKITFSTEQYDGTKIPHSHGDAPKYIIMTTSSIPDTPYTVKDAFFVNYGKTGAWYTTGSDTGVSPQSSKTTGVTVTDSYFKIGTTTSKPSYSSYLRYGIGIEYNIICFS